MFAWGNYTSTEYQTDKQPVTVMRRTTQQDWRLIPSISRSSGLGSDGDAYDIMLRTRVYHLTFSFRLIKPNVQEDYFRVVISKVPIGNRREPVKQGDA